MAPNRLPAAVGFAALTLMLLTGSGADALTAQSPTLGSVAGRVVDDRGVSVPDATLTLTRTGTTVRVFRGEPSGRFQLSGLVPGEYSLLVEQVGYQPVRVIAIGVLAGQVTQVPVTLERRPPPITGVVERRHTRSGDDNVASAVGTDLQTLARRRDATGLAHDATTAVVPGDGRDAFGLGVNGLLPVHSRLVVDGMEELLLRHPGFAGEGTASTLFARDAIAQATMLDFSLDPEWADGGGATLALVSATGSGKVRILPWVTYSGASLGGAADDNPADSSGTSLQAGVSLTGGFRGDSGAWALRADYRNIAEPTAAAFEGGTELVDAILAAAGTTDVTAWTSPTVRRWSGANVTGRLSWQPGRNSRFGARFGVASWDEENPLVSTSPVNGAGVTLTSSDLSAMGSFEVWGEEWHSMTRVGVQSASRDWSGASLPFTGIVSEGVALGSAVGLPGDFAERRLTVTETVTFPMGAHTLKVGGSASQRNVTHGILDDPGRMLFGSLEDLAAGVGSYARLSTATVETDFGVTELAGFGQDEWRVSPSLLVTVGARFELQNLPSDARLPNLLVFDFFGLSSAVVPKSSGSIAPRAAITWDAGARGATVLRLAGGLVPGRHDLAAFGETIRNSGDATMLRATGTIGWPNPTAATTVESTPITMYGDDVRPPRSFVFEGTLSQRIGDGTTMHVSGGYRHTDYLLRREDANMHEGPLATGDGGRAVWGELEQFDALIIATPGSNRRFTEFDHVWALFSSGYVDHKHATLSFSHRGAGGLSMLASYTWSNTEDNMLGQLSPDPADRALVLGTAVGEEDWVVGTSDLDVPHRLMLRAGYQHHSGLTVAARWRWRSGLPFTPGFRAGVDVNGDGSGNNDPVSQQAVAGLSGHLQDAGCEAPTGDFAARNSCRSDPVQALDAELGFQLPIGGSRRVMLTLSAFNLVSTGTGVIDRAAVLVDPAGTITTDANGRLVLPLLLNDNFGQLLSRRNDPRTIRIGLRVEN
jgi:hypothetical protein